MNQQGPYVPDPEDVEKNKLMAALAYIIFFLPLITCPDSAYGKYHANQGLLVLILGVGGNLILSLVPFIGWLLRSFFSVVVFIYIVIGLVNAFGGEAKELPGIGHYTIIK